MFLSLFPIREYPLYFRGPPHVLERISIPIADGTPVIQRAECEAAPESSGYTVTLLYTALQLGRAMNDRDKPAFGGKEPYCTGQQSGLARRRKG